MNSIEEMNKACIILDLMKAPKTQIVFVPKNEFEKRYGFVVPQDGHNWISFAAEPNGGAIDVIATIQTRGYSFVFIDPSQVIEKQQ